MDMLCYAAARFIASSCCWYRVTNQISHVREKFAFVVAMRCELCW
jgi:hypothetical protein